MMKRNKPTFCTSGSKYMEYGVNIISTVKNIETSKCVFGEKMLKSNIKTDINWPTCISPDITNMIFHLKNISESYDVTLPLAKTGLEYYFCISEDNQKEIKIKTLDDDIINGNADYKHKSSNVADIVYFKNKKSLGFIKASKGDYWRLFSLCDGIWNAEGFSSSGKSLSVHDANNIK